MYLMNASAKTAKPVSTQEWSWKCLTVTYFSCFIDILRIFSDPWVSRYKYDNEHIQDIKTTVQR